MQRDESPVGGAAAGGQFRIDPALLAHDVAGGLDQRAVGGQEGLAGRTPFDLVLDVVAAEQVLDPLFDLLALPLVGETEVEARYQFAGEHVGRPRVGLHLDDLEAGRREMLVAFVERRRVHVREHRGEALNRVLRQGRVGDVALFAVDGHGGAQRPAPPHPQGVAELFRAGWLSHHAPVDRFVAGAQRVHHAAGAVPRRAFFVAGDEKRQRAAVFGVFAGKVDAGADHGRDAGFHVGGAPALEPAVIEFRLERIVVPVFQRPRGHHVGVAGEAQHRRIAAVPRPQVGDLAEGHVLDAEAGLFQHAADQFLATAVRGGHRWPPHQLQSEVDRALVAGFSHRGATRSMKCACGCVRPPA